MFENEGHGPQGGLPECGAVFEAKYRLDDVLGEGGFARVYRATDLEIGRQVAIKVLKPTPDAFDQRAARFQREMKLVARLHGPHIAQMLEYGRTATGLMFMVLELVGGRDLDDVLRESAPLPEPVVVRILEQLLEALAEAHAAGLLHRDVKPGNVRVFEYQGDPWRVKLLDFGIARAMVRDDAALTATGHVVGTPRFMAPEQLLGEDLTPASDLYSLALVCFEALTGRESDHMRLFARRESVQVPRDAGVSPHVAGVLDRMLRRDPRERFRSAGDVLVALRDTRPPADRSAPSPTQSVSQERVVRPASVGVVAVRNAVLAVVLVLAAATAVLVATRERDSPREPAITPRVVTRPAPTAPRAEVPRVEEPRDPPAARTARSGCGKAAEPGQRRGRATVGLSSVEWVVHVPEGYDPDVRYPAMLLFHDDAAGPEDVIMRTKLDRTADKEGFIIVAPTDVDTLHVWSGDDDLENTYTALMETAADLCVDLDRVFAVGHGSGSSAPDRLTCVDWIAGYVISAHGSPTTEFQCAPAAPAPLLLFTPMKSRFQPQDGQPDCLGVMKVSRSEVEAAWRQRNQCSEKSHLRRLKSGRCWTFECDGAPFVSCASDGGRPWPGSPGRGTDFLGCDGPAVDFPQNEVLWAFLSQLRIREKSP